MGPRLVKGARWVLARNRGSFSIVLVGASIESNVTLLNDLSFTIPSSLIHSSAMAKKDTQNSQGAKPADPYSVPHTRPESRPDFSTYHPSSLPQSLQAKIDAEEPLYERLWEGTAPESTDSNVRYAAYATRIRTILISAQRYVAYTSDIGESFRPIAHPYLVKGAYGVSWAYLVGDVANEGWKAYVRNQAVRNPALVQELREEARGEVGGEGVTEELVKGAVKGVGQKSPGVQEGVERKGQGIPLVDDYRVVMLQRGIFQSVASMGLPAFTIHSIVKYSGKLLKDAKNTRIRSYGPIGLGLAAVPALPFMFDRPVEEGLEWVFHRALGGRIVGEGARGGRKEKEL